MSSLTVIPSVARNLVARVARRPSARSLAHARDDRARGFTIAELTIRITSTDGGPLRFNSGGDIVALRVHGMLNGETYLVVESPDLKNGSGTIVAATVGGGHAKVE